MSGIVARMIDALRAAMQTPGAPGDGERLRTQLVRHFGTCRYVARDPARGCLVIGHGRIADQTTGVGGVEPTEMALMLEHDIEHAVEALHGAYPWTRDLAPARMAVLIELAIYHKSLCPMATMTGFLVAVQDGRYGAAALALLGSQWARQVGVGRPDELAVQMQSGEWTT